MNKEKQKLIPELRFPEFKNDGDWVEKSLKEVCEVNPSNKNLPKEFVYIDLESVKSKKLLKKNIINLDGAPSRAQRLLKNEDVIFQMVRPYQKNNYFFKPLDNLEYVASTGYAQLRAFESKMYLFQYIHNDNFVNRVLDKCTGSNYPAINSGGLSNIKVEIPKPKEQQKIANCLSSLDNIITAETKKLEYLKHHKKGLLQQLFPAKGETKPQFRFPEFENDGDWKRITIEELVKNNTLYPQKDGNHGNIHPKSSDFISKGIPFIMASDIRNGKVNYSKCKHISKKQADKLQKGFAKEEDVLLTHKGTVGEVAIIEKNEFPYLMLTPQVTYYRVKDTSKLSNKFLISFFRSDDFQKTLLQVSGGGTRAYIGITSQGKLNISIPPTIDEQQKIANCLSSIESLITSQTTKVEVLKDHKYGLMQKLFPNVNSSAI